MLNTLPPRGAESVAILKNTTSSFAWLDELALNLAHALIPVTRPRHKDPLPTRWKTLESFLQSTYRYFDESSRTEGSVSHAAEWVLDNFYIIEQTLRQLNENLPPDFYQRLPKAEINGCEMARIRLLAFALTKAWTGR